MLPRKARLAVLLAPFLAACPQTDFWEPTNPGGGGYFMKVGVGPSGIVIACSDLSGPYRSLDHGETWEPIGPERGITSTHAGSVAFHAENAALIYVGSGHGLFRSTDFGQTFDEVIPNGYLEHVAIAPSDEDTVYAAWHPFHDACEGEVHKTVDGGDTWQRVDTNLPAGHRILKLLVSATDADTLYLMTGRPRFYDDDNCQIHRNAFRSDDGGVTFTEIGGSFGNQVIDIALDPHGDDGIYLSQDDGAVFHRGYLHKSTDRGANWTFLDEFGGFIWPDAEDPQTIRMIQCRYQYPWLPKDGIWESTQGGLAGTWVQKSAVDSAPPWVGGWSPVYWAFNASSNHGAVFADLSNPDAVWWVGAQFLYRSLDEGATVEQVFTNEVGGAGSAAWRSRGVDNVVVVDISINDANPGEIYAGFWDLGTWCSLDGGESWSMRNDYVASGDWEGGGANTWTVETDPARPGVVWAGQSSKQTADALLLRSEDSGVTWPTVAKGLPFEPQLVGLSLDRTSPVDNRTLYVTSDGDVYASVDDGATWELRLAEGGLRFTAVDRHDGSVVYAGGESGFWRSTSSGAIGTWSEVGLAEMGGSVSGLPNAYQWVGVYDIEPDPVVPGRVYVSVHGSNKGLYRSNDHGTTWEPRLLDDNHLRCVAVDPANSSILYASSSSALNAGGYATDSNGVLRSTDGGQTWTQQNLGLTWPFASTVEIGPAGSNVAFIGSPGTGIHRRTIGALSSDDVAISGSDGGSVEISLHAGYEHASKVYLLLASVSGTSPGLPVAPGVTLPLNNDWVLGLSLAHANTAVFTDTLGILDGDGAGAASFNVTGNALAPLVGTELAFAFLTVEPVDFASGAVRVLVAP